MRNWHLNINSFDFGMENQFIESPNRLSSRQGKKRFTLCVCQAPRGLNLNVLPIKNLSISQFFASPLFPVSQAIIDVSKIINKGYVQIGWKFIKKSVNKSVVYRPKKLFPEQPSMHINNYGIIVFHASIDVVRDFRENRRAQSRQIGLVGMKNVFRV